MNDSTQNKNAPVDELKKHEELEAQIKELAESIDKVEDERLRIENQLKKALADYQNLERELGNRVESRLIQMKKQVAAVLIEISDDINYGDQAKENLEMSEEVKSWVEGLSQTVHKMERALETLDIKQMELKKGDAFDSSLHEAVAVVKEGENNTVVEVVQPGYLMGDQVVRPARVVVSTANL